MKKAIEFLKAVILSFRLSRNMDRLIVFLKIIAESDTTDVALRSYANVIDWLRENHPTWGTDVLSLAEAGEGLTKTQMLIDLGEDLLYGPDGLSETAAAS